MLIVNADFTTGEFYRTAISGLCENTTYEFSSWMINLLPASGCGGVGIPINVKFEIWDNTDTNLLASGDTGNISGTSSPNWQQYALVFQTLPSQTSVILKMLNNGVGGCGNDLALDDIVFKSCGDNVVVEDTLNSKITILCEDESPFNSTLTVTPDFTIFSTHFYQWQESTDGINWVDIPGETNTSYTASTITTSTYYRVKVAEDAINVNNDSCNTTSEIYEIRIVALPDAPMSNGNLIICENDTTALSVTTPADVIVNWFDAPIGGNLLSTNSNSFKPLITGIYYAEAITQEAKCVSATRTPMQIEYLETPQVTNEILGFCENTKVNLHANPTNPNVVSSYLWNTGDITESIEISSPGTYTVEVANNSCNVTKTFTVTKIENPVIDVVESNGSNIIIKTINSGNFLYSIDGFSYQLSPVFSTIEGGQYTIHIKHQECDQIITTKHIHFHIPKFFTPNNDSANDTFNLKGIEFYSSSQVLIFDRYGKLLKTAVNTAFSWDGTFNNKQLPSGDYWYIIIVENQKFTGHFTLKR
jgi:gliding motility-associated-like protein